ncbi:MAG: glutaminyl-peptide cyclotransferase, partial [Gammaproteobacteria bacterium]
MKSLSNIALKTFYITIFLFSLPGILTANEILQYGYKVINIYPHDPEAFTQGLLYHEGYLYESTGNYNHSSLRKVELETGRIIQNKKIDDSLFAEGLALYKQQLIQLSWKKGTAFVYDKDSFKLIKTFDYP